MRHLVIAAVLVAGILLLGCVASQPGYQQPGYQAPFQSEQRLITTMTCKGIASLQSAPFYGSVETYCKMSCEYAGKVYTRYECTPTADLVYCYCK